MAASSDGSCTVRRRFFRAAHRHSSHVRRLSKSIVGRQFQRGADAKCFDFSQPYLAFRTKIGAHAPFGGFSTTMNAGPQIRDAIRLADAGTMPVDRERLPCMEMSQELPVVGPASQGARGTGRAAGVGCLFLRRTPTTRTTQRCSRWLPPATERRRREIRLALLCALGAVPSAGQGCPTA
jgi:hypothetical protein